MNPLTQVGELGQSVWLDYTRRDMIHNGELKRLIEQDGLKGMTSNPTIFEKAVESDAEYAEAIRVLARRNLKPAEIFERLSVEDIREAADVFKPLYQASHRADGYVSIEVSPEVGHDSKATVEEARRLWKELGRENVMIKVPASPQGVQAVEDLLGQGINVNITLLFHVDRYAQVAEAFFRGLERWAGLGGDLRSLASVASFFVSRIDTAVDGALESLAGKSASQEERLRLRAMKGKTGVANARLAYQRFKDLHSGPRWAALAAKGARPQRLLWASTSTKDPSLPELYYVEALIGPQTVDTVPPQTYNAYRDHGRPKARLEEGLDEAKRQMIALKAAGISFEQVTNQLLEEGLISFGHSYKQILDAVQKVLARVRG